MDILRINLALAVDNLESAVAVADGKNDGAIIDALILVQSCLELSLRMKGARRWIPADKRFPDYHGRYEVISDGRPQYCLFSDDEFMLPNVTHWRKPPRLPNA